MTTPKPLNVQEAAAYVGVTPGYLNNMRHHKKGPEWFVDKNRQADSRHRVKYHAAQLDAWNDVRKAKHTARASKAEAEAKRWAARAADLRSGKPKRRKSAEATSAPA